MFSPPSEGLVTRPVRWTRPMGKHQCLTHSNTAHGAQRESVGPQAGVSFRARLEAWPWETSVGDVGRGTSGHTTNGSSKPNPLILWPKKWVKATSHGGSFTVTSWLSLTPPAQLGAFFDFRRKALYLRVVFLDHSFKRRCSGWTKNDH